jgi:DNA primase
LEPGEPKYLNGPETAVFRKGELLYGMHQANEALRRERRALLVEGYLDVISLHARGYPTALATLGTAVTVEHIQVLRRRADEVVTLYDGDEAGRKAAFRSLDLFLAQGFPCRGILLPPEHDPDSFVRQGGNLTPLVDAARPLLEVYVEDVTTRWDLGTVEGKLAAADALAPKLALISDPLARDLYAKQVSEALGVDETQLRGRIRPSRGPRGRAAEPPRPEPALDPTERALLEILVHQPEHRPTFRAAGVEAWMRPGPLREAARFVADRTETAGDLPLDDAPEATRQALTEILVGDGKPLSPYRMLAAKLKLGALEAEACRVVDELRQAEVRGDQGRIDELMQEQTEVMRALVDCRRAAFGKAP